MRPAIVGAVGAIAVALAAPTAAFGHEDPYAPAPAPMVAADAACPGDRMDPDKVMQGEFDSSLQGSYIMVPFHVPKSASGIRVKYCFDKPENGGRENHTLDLGLWEPSHDGEPWGAPEFRGWGGSSHRDVTLSPRGFSRTKRYIADPKGDVPGRTTRGFRPGRVPPGKWAAELGAAAIVPKGVFDTDGKVGWRVEVDYLKSDKLEQGPGYEATPYDTRPSKRKPGWYAGDLHVHAEHSVLGDATMRETFDYAFRPLTENGAGLDFVMLSDYVTDSAWGEIGRYQPDYPGKLIDRSTEVITYRGHIGNHASVRYVDHRTGPVYVLKDGGGLKPLRGQRPASTIFDKIHETGGFTQINHPTIFPSSVPTFAGLCRGCPWDYSKAQTDYSKVDAIEIATGPPSVPQGPDLVPNPFTPTAIEFYERALSYGERIAAVGVSDTHHAGDPNDPTTQAPLGTATTVVKARELSEDGIGKAVRAGHTYVKIFGNGGPDLRFEGTSTDGEQRAIMGDRLRAGAADFTARVTGADPSWDALSPGPYLLQVLRNGNPIQVAPILSSDQTVRFRASQPGRYQLELMRATAPVAYSSPIYLERP